MAGKANTEFKAKPTLRNRDLAHRSGEDVSGPLTVIMAVIAFILAASFLYNLDWALNADLPAVSETPPSPAINPNRTPPPATAPFKS